ncbi:Cytochrome c oxidase assembly protein COX15 [Wickerhamomyces ciferrii]|uniref:Cytochrome c oxidase assembly protein COX15 n=1 Tax=Wickerhamomyces ciferrii (strain ATCC 14091 / BCRC 22168 / CBS 111 / JCM 3599 / NBRC 0793 / NRRL Y-1031 F-60-10) TaxID=1206466 RepID=K0K7Y7_WICCF|nr:Cytochrome c oxidase assembly protein COX15 [Wickerhamomyces ciferrii]CCH40930.1 Cytochrome c oxidase assembly protein COX15 [Wickerhamomyces ciferrii]
MSSALARSQFFFMRNSAVLKTARASCISNFIIPSCSNISTHSTKKIIGSSLTKRSSLQSQSNKFSKFTRSITTSASKKHTISAASNATINLANPDQISSNQTKTESTFKPKRNLINTSKYVGYWLIGTSGLVFGIVVLGGLTRLTESGLSITEWKPVTGSIPPLTQKDWEEEFNKYKDSPEFKQLNSHITLEEFKFIFFMEWAHRLWGRAIGVVMLLPAAYFAYSRKTSPRVNRRMIGLVALLGLQGFIGWWMVKSGLDEEGLKERRSKPTVSQYRLTTHLGAAFLLYMGMIWTGLEILRESKWTSNPKNAFEIFQKLDNPALKPLRNISLALIGLTFLTAMSGGLVAGLDAGLIYNTFPHMGDDIIPSRRELFDDLFAGKEDKSDKFWRNMLENPATVQLNHRILAMTTFFSILATHLYANRIKYVIPKSANRSLHAVMGVVTLQAALGISTLIYLVPIPLASAHQAGALALLTSALIFAANLRKPRTPIRVLTSGIHVQNIKKAKQGSKILSEASKLAK